MIFNHYKIAWRNLSRNRAISGINILGLSIGIAACVLISIYILHETSYDQHIPDSENIYRLYGVFNFDGKVQKGAHFSANNASTIAQDFEEVVKAGRLMDNPLFYGAGSNNISIGDLPMQYNEDKFVYADQAMVDILKLKMVYGISSTVLANPKTIVISERKSRKYFKDQNPVGQTIYLNGNVDDLFTISGVMEDFPSNSHLDYDFLITLSQVEFGAGEQTRWLQSNYFNYFSIAPGTDIPDLEKRITEDILANYMVPALEAAGNVMATTIVNDASLQLQPISDIHLHSADIFDAHTRGDIRFVWLFGFVALFILLIACVNFVNLSTAQSSTRAKEVGLRKVLGSGKGNLVRQFMTESFLITFISIVLGIFLAYSVLPHFNQLADKTLQIPLATASFILVLIAATLGIGVLAGTYPAFYLSSFNPIKVLKGKIRQGSKSAGLRSSLVVFQFTISIILIVATLLINQQMNFILNKKVGFEKEQVIQIHSTNALGDQIEVFKEEVKKQSNVVNASISDYLPVDGGKRNGNSFWNEGRVQLDERVGGQAWIIDEDYLATLGMKLVEGRNFSKDRKDGELSVIINQRMAKELGLQNPIGKKITRGGDRNFEIIGIVEDFNFETFRDAVRPIALFSGISPSIVSVKVDTRNVTSTLQRLEETWNRFSPNLEFRHTFMDQSFANMYADVRRIGIIFSSFALLAIFVACLGLFALSAFIVEQRRKEMSIRKVLGASLQNIFQLLTRQFVALVFLSLIIAIPVASYLMKKWLQDYAYRIEITWHAFAIAGIFSLVITLVTISYHALRTATVNPMVDLKEE